MLKNGKEEGFVICL